MAARRLVVAVLAGVLLTTGAQAADPPLWQPPAPPVVHSRAPPKPLPWYAQLANILLHLFQAPPGVDPYASPFSDHCAGGHCPSSHIEDRPTPVP